MMSNEFIRRPSTEVDVLEMEAGFFEKFKIPRILGIVDGTHIPIDRPRKSMTEGQSDIDFLNYKGNIGMLLLIQVDKDFSIEWFNFSHPGSTDDKTVFNNSQNMMDMVAGRSYGALVAGDHGFQDSQYLLKSFGQVIGNSNITKEKFNYLFNAMRVTVEQTIGFLKSKFPFLSNKMTGYKIPIAQKIVVSLLTLYNYAKLHDGSMNTASPEQVAQYKDKFKNLDRMSKTPRDDIFKNYFVPALRSVSCFKIFFFNY